MIVSVWSLDHFPALTSVESELFSLCLLRLKFWQVLMSSGYVGENWYQQTASGVFELHVLAAIYLALYCMFCSILVICWWSCALFLGLRHWWAVYSDSHNWVKRQDLCAGQGSLLQFILEWVVFTLQVRLEEPSTAGAGMTLYLRE